ncbi:MAG: hypothetical protein R3B41_02875, partial [Candidatus Doudnabacteria bacterium]
MDILECKNLAQERGGKCLSKVYTNAHTKHEWQCDKGHKWQATPTAVKRGSWCPKCANLNIAAKLKGNLEQMQKLASKKGGRCLFSVYINAQHKLEWQCAEGHVWKSFPGSGEEQFSKQDFQTAFSCVTKILENPNDYWLQGDYKQKRTLLSVYFERGIIYDREKGFQTADLPLIVRLNCDSKTSKSHLVEMAGVKPASKTV